MPHCIIEYSQSVATRVEIDALVAATHAGAISSGLFPESDIKTRAIAYAHYNNGGTQDAFVHVTVRLLSGRDDQQKSDLSEKLLAGIEPLLADVASVGVEICDMHRESYRKRVL